MGGHHLVANGWKCLCFRSCSSIDAGHSGTITLSSGSSVCGVGGIEVVRGGTQGCDVGWFKMIVLWISNLQSSSASSIQFDTSTINHGIHLISFKIDLYVMVKENHELTYLPWTLFFGRVKQTCSTMWGPLVMSVGL